jgi:hypothetical protein
LHLRTLISAASFTVKAEFFQAIKEGKDEASHNLVADLRYNLLRSARLKQLERVWWLSVAGAANMLAKRRTR